MNNSNNSTIMENVKENTSAQNEEKKDVQATTDTPVATETKTETLTVEETPKDEVQDGINLSYLDKDFIYDYMSIPTHSREEFRAVTYIILWARANDVEYQFDKKGNIYLTKGKLDEGEYYPCVTAHLDTVQDRQSPYAKAGVRLDVKTRINAKQKHEIYCEGFGIGGDDKAGVAICLNMFKHFDKLKAAFFLEEEIGCQGSKQMDVDWFDNVGYVIGYDSPDLNRAARICSGEKLFDRKFFEAHMATIVKKWGLTDFRSEPFTDVVQIREKTDIICMNFGTGYYNCHMPNEYCVLEDMDHACGMGIELIQTIGNTRHEMKKEKWGANRWEVDREDEAFYDEFNGKPRRTTTTYTTHTTSGGTNNYGGYSGGTGTTTPSTTTTSTSATGKKDENMVDFETLGYISEKYEEKIENLRALVKEKCNELKLDFDKDFAPIFDAKIQF